MLELSDSMHKDFDRIQLKHQATILFYTTFTKHEPKFWIEHGFDHLLMITARFTGDAAIED